MVYIDMQDLCQLQKVEWRPVYRRFLAFEQAWLAEPIYHNDKVFVVKARYIPELY